MDNIYSNAVQGLLASAPAAATPAQQAAVQQAIQKILADPNQMTTITGQNKGGENAWLWQPTEQNTTYQAYNFGGQNNYMTGEVAKYLKALGYGGNLASGGTISDADAQAVNAFLQERGLSVQTGTHQVPGASQHTGIQRIIDANGVPIAVDARNNRYDGNDRMTDIAKAGALAAAAYYAPQFFAGEGAGAGAAVGGTPIAGEGIAYLSPTLTGAAPVVTTAALPTGLTAGLTGGSALSALPALGAGAGLLSSLGSVGSAIGGLASAAGALKGAGTLAAVAGGVLGATQGGKNQTSTTTQQIDPRMAEYIYGSGYGDKSSMLGAAQDWWKNNQSGMNANMAQGLDTLKSLYTSPAYTQGYTQMRDVGQGLLGRQIAGNPFTQGGLLGAPASQPQAQMPGQMPPPDIGVPPQMMQRPPLSLLQGSQQMPGPDVGLQKFNRPAWSI